MKDYLGIILTWYEEGLIAPLTTNIGHLNCFLVFEAGIVIVSECLSYEASKFVVFSHWCWGEAANKFWLVKIYLFNHSIIYKIYKIKK